MINLLIIGFSILIITIILYFSYKTYIFKKDLFSLKKKFILNSNKFYYEIDNVLTNDECNILINNAKNNLSRSTVMSFNNNKYIDAVDSSRTSEHTWLNKNEYKKITIKIEKLINLFLDNITSEQFEDIQIARYKPKQEYKEHYDICHPTQAYPEHINACIEDYRKYNSVRYLTLILYLNDNFDGGETYFPYLNKKIKPKKGKALIFLNCNPNNNTIKNGLCDVISNSKHAGLPVINNNKKENEKWIANIWVRTKKII